MKTKTATANAHPNIALIKYWGDQDSNLHIPANGSISMNLKELFTRTSVRFDPSLGHDKFNLDGREIEDAGLVRVRKLLERGLPVAQSRRDLSSGRLEAVIVTALHIPSPHLSIGIWWIVS